MFTTISQNRKIRIEKEYDHFVFYRLYANGMKYEFYSVPIIEWREDKIERQTDKANWHIHMKEKNWFNEEMYNWMNNNCTC